MTFQDRPTSQTSLIGKRLEALREYTIDWDLPSHEENEMKLSRWFPTLQENLTAFDDCFFAFSCEDIAKEWQVMILNITCVCFL